MMDYLQENWVLPILLQSSPEEINSLENPHTRGFLEKCRGAETKEGFAD